MLFLIVFFVFQKNAWSLAVIKKAKAIISTLHIAAVLKAWYSNDKVKSIYTLSRKRTKVNIKSLVYKVSSLERLDNARLDNIGQHPNESWVKLPLLIIGRAQADGMCFLPNGSQLTKAIRKEYRMLTDDERRRFHSALIQLKRSGEYDKLALIHGQAAVSGGAHSGPAFLPWHREFLKRCFITVTAKTIIFPDLLLDNTTSTKKIGETSMKVIAFFFNGNQSSQTRLRSQWT